MNSKNRILILLGLLSGILMSIPYLVPHCGWVALFGLVPLLCMDRIATINNTKRFWMYHYGTFVLWNAITTFWVCNATVGGGIFAVLANSLQMSLVFGLFRLSKKHFKGTLPYIFLAVAWIAWEKYYFELADISWPWLVLGNAFSQSISTIQWYEYTGTLGGSLWIWACNLSIFGLMVALSDGSWTRFNPKAKVTSILGITALFIAPIVISKNIWKNYQEVEDPMEVLILQPNIDPYNKFEALTQSQQDAILASMLDSALQDRRVAATDTSASAEAASALLVLAPETFTSPLFTDQIYANKTWRTFVDKLKQYPGVSLLFGASSYDRIASASAPSHTARQLSDGTWIESHNSALCIDGTGRTDLFHKNKLVVAVEMTPYPAFFCKIDDMLGGVMGRCIGQGDITLMECATYDADGHFAQRTPFGCAICYESVYPEYYTGYAAKGARFMTIITNDAWWGDTPGYRQHLSYASLRAIETRRSIARCANTGISAIINQSGEIVESTPWWERASIRSFVNMNSEMTFFTVYGDIVGRVCGFLFIITAAALFSRVLSSRREHRRSKKSKKN